MSEQACTAIRADGDIPPNVLFTPPCACPRCAPATVYNHDGNRDDGWLRVRGHQQRYRVEMVELGAAGHAVLG